MSTRFTSWISEWLPTGGHRLRVLRLRGVERWLRRRYDANRATFPTRLHGFPALLNGGNPYPFLLVAFPDFNRCLVELVRTVAQNAGRPVVVVDVGASLGNTVLLLEERCAGRIAAIHSVEADPEFLPLFRQNTARFPHVSLHAVMLARAPGLAPALVHHHPGTAAALGAERVAATTLDAELLGTVPCVDVLKIDIDGSDGEALQGGRTLLRRDQPAVIFEWHPALARAAGNDPGAAFAALREAGYRRCLWFRNTGPFSHFSGIDDPEIATWEQWLCRMQPHGDPHFDIVALPPRLEHLADTLASVGTLPLPGVSAAAPITT